MLRRCNAAQPRAGIDLGNPLAPHGLHSKAVSKALAAAYTERIPHHDAVIVNAQFKNGADRAVAAIASAADCGRLRLDATICSPRKELHDGLPRVIVGVLQLSALVLHQRLQHTHAPSLGTSISHGLHKRPPLFQPAD
jgi:hypothetical protein